MISSDTLPIDYVFGSERYILSKTELRCVDSAKPANNFSVPLNQVNPNFFHEFSFNPLVIIAILYLVICMIGGTYQLITGSMHLSSDDSIGLVIFSVIVFRVLHYCYKQYTSSAYFHLTSIFDNKIACSIPFTRQTRQKALDFMDTIVKRIRNCSPSNDSVLSLLSWYHLISQIEWSQMDASIKQKEVLEKDNKPVIINMLKHRT